MEGALFGVTLTGHGLFSLDFVFVSRGGTQLLEY